MNVHPVIYRPTGRRENLVNILIVGESLYTLKVVKVLNELGYGVVVAQSLVSASIALDQFLIDIVLLLADAVQSIIDKHKEGFAEFALRLKLNIPHIPTILVDSKINSSLNTLVSNNVHVSFAYEGSLENIADDKSPLKKQILYAEKMRLDAQTGLVGKLFWALNNRWENLFSSPNLPIENITLSDLALSDELALMAIYLAKIKPHPRLKVTMIINGAQGGIVGMAESQAIYNSAMLYPEGFVAYHTKLISKNELAELHKFAKMNSLFSKKLRNSVRFPWMIGWTRMPHSVKYVAVFRTVLSANQAQVCDKIQHDNVLHVTAREQFLRRDLKLFQEWAEVNRERGQKKATSEQLNDYKLRISRAWISLHNGTAPQELIYQAYQNALELISKNNASWRPINDGVFWWPLLDAQPQNIGGLWGILVPDYSQIKKALKTGINLSNIAVFDPQLGRQGLLVEDIVHLVEAPEFRLSPKEKINWYSEFFFGLFDTYGPQTTSSALMQVCLLGSYKAPRKMAITINFLKNAKNAYVSGRITTGDYQSMVKGYAKTFEHWRAVGSTYATAALCVVADYEGSDPLQNLSNMRHAFEGKVTPDEAIDNYGRNNSLTRPLAEMVKASLSLKSVENPSMKELLTIGGR